MACFSVLVLLLLSALLQGGCSSPLHQQSARSSFSNSLRLTRAIRGRVQQLILLYKEKQFGDSQFEDRTLMLNTLPSAAFNYRIWRQMQDTERLVIASRDLKTFWTHLESQRQKLDLDRDEERESGEVRRIQKRNKRGRPQLSLSQTILAIQLDMRDLMSQVNTQLANMKILKQETTTDYPHTSSPTSAFSGPTQPFPALQSTQISEEPLNPAATAPQTSTSLVSSVSSPRFTPDRILTSTQSGMEVVSGRRIVSADVEEASSTVRDTQSSTVYTQSSTFYTQSSTVYTQSSTVSAVEPKLTTQVSSSSRWVSRLEGYVILRDLEKYLSKLARDYTLLQNKY